MSITLGILGGMGPLASAEFVRTIYGHSLGQREQQAPFIIMYSDPSMPDRTDALIAGEYGQLLEKVAQGLYRLCDSGATKLVICCITSHCLLPKLPPNLTRMVISLPDLIMLETARRREKQLIVCTTGTRKLELFQNHPQWGLIQDYVVWPDEADQEKIHNDIIYRIKKNCSTDELVPTLVSLLRKYEVNSFIVGCTEIHLLAGHLSPGDKDSAGYRCIDPLTIVAKEIATGGRANRER